MISNDFTLDMATCHIRPNQIRDETNKELGENVRFCFEL